MTRRRWRAFLGLMVALGLPVSALAQDVGDSFIDHVARQIICRMPPDPTPTLFYLSKRKRIDL